MTHLSIGHYSVNLINIGAAVLWILGFVYAVLGAIDFGSSFWRLYFLRKGQWPAETVARTYVSPTWELINAFLILIPVTLTGLFPDATFAFGSILLVPATLLLVLIALRGAYWQFGYASSTHKSRTVTVVGITGLVLPGAFMTLLPLSQGGYTTAINGVLHVQLVKFFTSPDVYLFALFGIFLSLYLSALFLARYAYNGHQKAAYESFRRVAVGLGPLSLALGLLALIVPHQGLDFSRQIMTWWPLTSISFLAFCLTESALIWTKPQAHVKGNPGIALYAALVQLAAADAGYGLAHHNFWLYPYVAVASSASNPTMFEATLLVLLGGALVLAPGLLWFRRLFITDAKYVKSAAESTK
ncbi:cytochrome d ubiquinol oxidase subunit II [Alicyclobacillus sp. SO9]|uniref:cytochrome d ubiquinol oxidase subunit II n=1 Tax=Alicyclobacillus sp. SO9 TaxID=2665646 RepID=UPI0018E7EA56|nr:cytochrome d ubiquinol oxidase subunit II [Alicyclobacillus sp. SO9]QQE78285.1 cytochrome d ubiquinol oxidase subunit II [Alicyclobacillus sp. SO9]